MLKIEKHTNDGFIITTNKFSVSYNIELDRNCFTMHFEYFKQNFFILSSCDSTSGLDINKDISSFSLKQYLDNIEITWNCSSSLWDKKIKLIIFNDSVEYFYEIFGNGFIDTLRYFEGIFIEDYFEIPITKHFNDKKPMIYRTHSRASKINFTKIFNPEPNTYDKQYFESFEDSLISAHSDIDFCGGNFIFNPSLLAFGMSNNTDKEWVTLGLIVKPEEYHFSEYEYKGGNFFGLSLNYWGLFQIKNKFETPRILIFPSNNEFDCMKGYVTHLEKYKYIKKSKELNRPPDWWKGPIICGWGNQCYMADLFRLRSPKDRNKDLAAYYMCTQGNYEMFVDYILKRTDNWKILCIDARWTLSAGKKTVDAGRWPNLREFVDKIHSMGKKVIIWWGMWETEGLDDNLCIKYFSNNFKANENREGRFQKFGKLSNNDKIAPDPTLDKFKLIIIESIKKLFSSDEDCYDIDGIKIDHVAAAPGLYGMEFPDQSKRIMGIELIKYYHKFLYNEIKKIKKDALIIGQSPNPYFRDCADMIRLGDIYSGTFSIIDQMNFRINMIKISNPTILLDMDNWPIPNLESLKNYMEYQVENGVPSLYYSSHLDTTNEQIPEDFYKRIDILWKKYLDK